ncbi:MerR family transcriptional regulator [Kitasatospora sp. NPDC049285]|uniref:MerR family transcriptional regulator n=1 Tax=Kitasatospora sp. NPDC049285 TaxID=3157096 RepID=UPI00343892C1
MAETFAGFGIGEVSEATGLSAHTLRWYERIGLLDPVDRSYAGQRRYSEADLARLAFLTKLRLTGMPVADMVRYVELVRAGDGTRRERQELLVAHREEVRQRLADLHATLAVIDLKIEIYGAPDEVPVVCRPEQLSARTGDEEAQLEPLNDRKSA